MQVEKDSERVLRRRQHRAHVRKLEDLALFGMAALFMVFAILMVIWAARVALG